MSDTIYCASNCECINCYHNKANITNYNALHNWMRKEDIEDCPFNSEDGFDDYEIDWCYECGGLGDDYSIVDGELVRNCDSCLNNPNRTDLDK